MYPVLDLTFSVSLNCNYVTIGSILYLLRTLGSILYLLLTDSHKSKEGGSRRQGLGSQEGNSNSQGINRLTARALYDTGKLTLLHLSS